MARVLPAQSPMAGTRFDARRFEAATGGDPGLAAAWRDNPGREEPLGQGSVPGNDPGGGSAASAIGWSAIGNWSSQLASLAFFLVLTHLLSPGEIGLFVLAVTVQAFLGAFVDQSMGEVIIQHPGPSETDIDTAFWLDCGLALALAAATAAGAGALASSIGHPQLEDVVRALCLAVVMGALGNIPTAILQRQLRFGLAARIAFFSQIVSGVVAVVLALRGWGVWSLVANQLCETALKSSLMWYHAGWLPKARIEARSVRSLSSYWLHTIGFRLFFFARANADRLIIGIVLGPTILGFYTTAMRIVRMVVDTFCEGVSKAVLVVLSRLHDDRNARERGFERLLRLTVLATFPVLGGLAILGPQLVPHLFGARWAPVGSILPVLCVIGFGIIMLYLHGITLRVIGRPQVNFAIFAALTTLDVALLLALLPWGLDAALAALAVRGLVAVPFYWLLNRREVGIGPATLGRSLVPGAVSCISCVAAITVAEEALAGRVPDFVQLAAGILAAGLVYGLMLFVFARRDFGFLLAGRRGIGGAREAGGR